MLAPHGGGGLTTTEVSGYALCQLPAHAEDGSLPDDESGGDGGERGGEEELPRSGLERGGRDPSFLDVAPGDGDLETGEHTPLKQREEERGGKREGAA